MKFRDFYNETVQGAIDQMILEVNLVDLSKTIPSERNREWLKKRRDTGNTGSFLKDVVWNNKKDTLLLKFNTNPTPTIPIKKINKKNGTISNAKIYKTEIQFEKVNSYLGSKSEFISLTKGTQIKRIRDMTKSAKVRLFTSSLDFIFQGSWMRSIENDYNLYPIPQKNNKDTGIWKSRHGNKNEYITKNLLEVIQNIAFIPDEISKLIRDKYSNK